MKDKGWNKSQFIIDYNIVIRVNCKNEEVIRTNIIWPPVFFWWSNKFLMENSMSIYTFFIFYKSKKFSLSLGKVTRKEKREKKRWVSFSMYVCNTKLYGYIQNSKRVKKQRSPRLKNKWKIFHWKIKIKWILQEEILLFVCFCMLCSSPLQS